MVIAWVFVVCGVLLLWTARILDLRSRRSSPEATIRRAFMGMRSTYGVLWLLGVVGASFGGSRMARLTSHDWLVFPIFGVAAAGLLGIALAFRLRPRPPASGEHSDAL